MESDKCQQSMPRLLLDNSRQYIYAQVCARVAYLPLCIWSSRATSYPVKLLLHESRSGNDINRQGYYDNFNTLES